MEGIIPLFPLQLVVFPGEDLNLHIFEPRYRQLVKECEEEGITFGIPAFINNKVQEIGTEVELLRVEKRYASGESDIRTRGIGLFRIDKFYNEAPGKLYAGAEVEYLDVFMDGETDLNVEILELAQKLFELLNITKELPEDPADLVTYDIAHHVGFTVKQEYELLSISQEVKRQEFMRDHLKQLIPVVREMERLRQRVQMNGHFKNMIPPKF